uniref:Uncharacterized protein n=1 Tax=Anguilla anguilla TaxID=7936 RepID=A0A0E9Y085_ANGAN
MNLIYTPPPCFCVYISGMRRCIYINCQGTQCHSCEFVCVCVCVYVRACVCGLSIG